MNAVLETMVDERIGPGERLLALKGKLCRKFLSGRAEVLSTFSSALCYAVSSCGAVQGNGILVSPLTDLSKTKTLEKAGYRVIVGEIDSDTKTLTYESLEKFSNEISVVLMDDTLGSTSLDNRWNNSPIPVIEDITYSLKGSCGSVLLLSLEEGAPICGATGGAIMFTRWFDGVDEPENGMQLPDLNAALASAQIDTLNTRMERITEIWERFQDSAFRSKTRVFPTISKNVFALEVDFRLADMVDYSAKFSVPARPAFSNTVGYADCENHVSATGTLLRTLRFPLYYFLQQDEVEAISGVIASLH